MTQNDQKCFKTNFLFISSLILFLVNIGQFGSVQVIFGHFKSIQVSLSHFGSFQITVVILGCGGHFNYGGQFQSARFARFLRKLVDSSSETFFPQENKLQLSCLEDKKVKAINPYKVFGSQESLKILLQESLQFHS